MERIQRHQVPLYLAAIAVGAAVGLLAPSAGPAIGAVIEPALALLLYATFLGVPFARIGAAVRDVRFLAAVVAANFVAAPLVAFAVTRFVAHEPALLAGALFVLLAPCIDYVIVFAGLAGGAKDRLLAATPLLMLLQIVLLPGFLWLFAGPELAGAVEPAPFVRAFLVLVALPLAAAWLTQSAVSRSRGAARLRDAGLAAMVPLMMLVLAVVVASQIAAVGARAGELLPLVPAYLLFAAAMALVGLGVARLTGLDASGRIAVAFSGATRNSLVVLPLVLALPPSLSLAPLAVVAQTLVELVAMIVLVRLVPALLRR